MNGLNLGPKCDANFTEADDVWDDLTEIHLDAFVGKLYLHANLIRNNVTKSAPRFFCQCV